MIAGRYSLEREIGRGGSGVVWLGRDEVLGRQVAVKRIGLLPGADRTDLARAEREARLSAQLNHPHVVAVFDVVVETETDARWLVMEYVDGVNLHQLVRQQGALSPDDAAPLLAQVADALVAAHAAGIAHRDVKPSNVLVDHRRQVKLTDFGIARVATDPSLTQTGMVTGSPAYLAPEVAIGGRGDEAADVWSLGATAFFLLAGRPPYEIGDHVLSALYQIVNEEPPRLPDAGWLTPLLAGTMVRDPATRWTMRQVRDFLTDPHSRVLPPGQSGWAEPDHAVESEGTRPLERLGAATAPPAGPAPRTAGPARRRPSGRRLLIGAGLLLAVLLAVVLYAVLPNRDATPKADRKPASTPSATPSGTESTAPRPTQAGIEAFIRDYVATVSSNPDASWQMLSPKFQVESGGIEAYRRFWGPASNGRVLSISANPDNLTVSYQVRFDGITNGPGPTVLDLKFDGERYLIDGERTEGFVPAG